MCGAQSENLTNKTAEMYTATGAANAAFEKQTDTLDYDIQMIKNLGANFLTEIGTKIILYVKDLADAVLPAYNPGWKPPEAIPPGPSFRQRSRRHNGSANTAFF